MLISAWQIVAIKHKDWILNIYGDGSLRNELKKQINDLNVSSSCILNSATDNIMSKYLESSIYVMSSRTEAFGLVLIEAMSCGLPCVSFDCPFGPSEIIHNSIDGILVEPNNIIKLADSINFYIENEAMRLKAGVNARMNVERFNPDIIMRKWTDLFQSVNNKQ